LNSRRRLVEDRKSSSRTMFSRDVIPVGLDPLRGSIGIIEWYLVHVSFVPVDSVRYIRNTFLFLILEIVLSLKIIFR